MSFLTNVSIPISVAIRKKCMDIEAFLIECDDMRMRKLLKHNMATPESTFLLDNFRYEQSYVGEATGNSYFIIMHRISIYQLIMVRILFSWR